MKKRALLGSVALLALLGASQAHAQLIISEFRVRGPSGANDEFIELYNNSGSDHTVAGGGIGYAVAASDGVARCVLPNGMVIPNRGHYLCTNSVAYSLSGYATGDATYTTDIPDNAGIAMFNTSVAANFTLANRMDAVGSTSESNTLYKEGTGYSALTPFSIDYSFYRDTCGKGGSITTIGACPIGTTGKIDTNNNAADFIFVDTNGTSAGAGQRLGAPGPQNLVSAITGTGVLAQRLDATVNEALAPNPPNRVRDFTSDPANNSTFGTLDVRRRIVNNTGGNMTRLRFRIDDLTTFPAPSGFADLRPRTSTLVVVSGINDAATCLASNGVATTPCTINVQGTTLEQPPSQPNGGGFNSSMSAGTVTLGTPLASGASINVRFLLGIQQTGCYKFGISAETLPGGGFDAPVVIEGSTEMGDACSPPTVQSVVRASANPTNAGTVNYTVTFDAPVSGVDATDFALTTSGSIAGASVTGATPVGGPGPRSTYTVAVNTGTGDGTLRLDVLDDNTIVAGTFNLAGPFTGGEVYDVDRTAPTAIVDQTVGQADPTDVSPIAFTVTFSEDVTGFDSADVLLAGTAGATTAVVTGGPAIYTVDVSGMTANGTVIASIGASAATDAAGNGSTASVSSDNTVTFTGIDDVPPSVTIDQAAGQADPANTSPIAFTVVFSEDVSGFDATDIVLSGTAGATIATITGGPALYDVTVSGMTGAGTVIASIGAGAATDAAGNASLASVSTDNTVTYDSDVPTVTVEQAVGQADPANASPINFTVTFSESVSGFDGSDVLLGGTAGATTAVVSGGPSVYAVAVSGMTGAGTVTASVPADAATDASSNGNSASTSVDNSVTFDDDAPTVTIDQSAGQADPTEASPIIFTVVFSEAVTGFTGADVSLGGTAGATTATVTGGPSTYTVAVSGMTDAGTVTAAIAAGVANDDASNANLASTSTDNSVTFEINAPTAAITQAAGQDDETTTSPVNFTVTFSEPVTGFDASDVIVGGTAGATTAVVTGGPASYNVAVSGMTGSGTVTIDVPAGAAEDADGNPSAAATATDNLVVFGTDPVVAPASPAVIPATSLTTLLLMMLVFAGIGGVFWRRQSA